ncbi:MAG: pyridoxamine 5'-phosphate oxidase family protein [Pseudomonadota bacterium]
MSEDRYAFAEELTAFYDHAWQTINRGLADRKAASRFLTLSTIDEQGVPRSRMVVIRDTDKADGSLLIYTDARAGKISEIAAVPSVAALIWEPRWSLQIRFIGEASVVLGDELDALRSKLSERALRDYTTELPPATMIDDPKLVESQADRVHFSAIRLRLKSIELLCLAPQGHRRARYERDDNWLGQWLVP